jgi:hypothetical protein
LKVHSPRISKHVLIEINMRCGCSGSAHDWRMGIHDDVRISSAWNVRPVFLPLHT